MQSNPLANPIEKKFRFGYYQRKYQKTTIFERIMAEVAEKKSHQPEWVKLNFQVQHVSFPMMIATLQESQ